MKYLIVVLCLVWVFVNPASLIAQDPQPQAPVLHTGQAASSDSLSLAILTQDKKKEGPPELAQYDQPPQVIHQVRPMYPSEALRDRMEGTVWTNLWVDESGKVVSVKIMKSEADVFNEAAIDAAKQWTFKPAILKDKPVAVWLTVPFKFSLVEYKQAQAKEATENPNEKMLQEKKRKQEQTEMGNPEEKMLMKKKMAQAEAGIRNLKEEMPPADFTPYEKPPEVVKQVAPKYPAEAKQANLRGAVVLSVWLNKEGVIQDVKIQRSDAEVFNAAAIEAVKQWRFKPALLNGTPVAVWVTIPFKFSLDGTKPAKEKK